MSLTLGYSLLPHQGDHVKRLYEILSKNKSALDLSLMGCGKTFTTCYLATLMKLVIVVIAPASVEHKWREMKEKYNAPVWKVISYESLRGVKNKHLKHGLLKRVDKVSQKGIESVSFTSTPLLEEVTEKRGILFVFDEIQKAKNKSTQAKAVISLTSFACRQPKSRILLLSGTPIDKPEQSVNIMRSMNLIDKPFLAKTDTNTGQVKMYGFKKLLDTSMRLDSVTTENVMDEYSIYKITDYPKMSYRLFLEVVLTHLSSKMPLPDRTATLKIHNRYFTTTDSERIFVEDAIMSMKSAVGNEHDRIDFDSFGVIQKCLVKIENGKVPTMIRKTLQVLRDQPSSKVCLMVNYTSTIKMLVERLEEHSPIVVNGSVSKSKRNELIVPFQTGDARLLICNMDVMSTGVDLDDKSGSSPRYVLASPNYKTMTIQQMCYRFLRSDTKSDTSIDFVYINSEIEETSVLSALCRKACTMRDASLDSKNSFVKYPDEYVKIVD